MIDPEGQHLDEMEPSPSIEMILTDEATGELMEAPTGAGSENSTLPTTGRMGDLDLTLSGHATCTETAPRERSIFLCDTPSEDSDDEGSSLSSNSLPGLRKSYAFIDSTSTEEDDDEEVYDFDSERVASDETSAPVRIIHTIKFQRRTAQMGGRTPSLSRYSLVLGLLVGCFIQSSSLGANYVLTVVFGHDFEQLRDQHSKIMMFSLGWSLATSTMGVLVVLFLRSLLQVVPGGARQSALNLWHVEYSFAFGALAGVCLAWCGTDVLLGFRAHAFHSLLTLAFSAFAKSVMSCTAPTDTVERVFGSEHDESSRAYGYLPLMEDNNTNGVVPSWRSLHPHFKAHGLVLGVLIGFFIQMSSLGASFLLDTFANQDGSRVELTSDGLLAFSLGWSFVFGAMGVMILLILRSLLMMVCARHCQKFAHKLGLMLEFYFAVGCLVGVNLAWVLTDLGLGLQAHVMRSMVTLGAAAIWCRVLSCCFFSSHAIESDGDENDENEYEQESMDWRKRDMLVNTEPASLEVYEAVLLV